MRWVSRLIAGVILAIAPIVVLAARFVWDPDVPSALPTHWDGQGQVDGATGQAVFFWICLVISVGLALGGIAAVANRRVTRSSGVAIGTGFGAWLMAAVYLMVLDAAQGATGPQQVHVPPQTGIALLVVGVAAAVAMAVLLPADRPRPAASRPASTVRLQPQEQVTWVGAARSPWLAVLAVVLALASIVVAFTSWPASLALLAGTVISAWAHVITVRIDDDGVHTMWGPVRWPRMTVSLGAITVASAEEINPTQWGGWGYRISPRGRAAIVRKGPGLVVEREGQSTYAVTVDHADDAADAVNALVTRGKQA